MLETTPDNPNDASDAVAVSIIVPVRNEARSIERTLGQLLELNAPGIGYEIVVVDGDSSDATPDLVREIQKSNSRVRLLHNPHRLSSAARNLGIRSARGRYVVIVDGHCDVENRNYLVDLCDAFGRSGADCLGRPQTLDIRDASPLQKSIAAARSSWLGHHPASHIYSGDEGFVPPASVAVAYRRSVFGTVGWFDESFDACEDVEFNHRVGLAGLTCFSTPKIAVRYHPRSRLSGLFYQMVRYGRGRMRLLRKHPDTRSLGSLVPLVFVIGILAGIPLAFVSADARVVFATAMTLYVALVFAAVISIGSRPGNMRLVPWLFAVFPTIHIGAGLGLLEELCNGWLASRNARRALECRVGTLPAGPLACTDLPRPHSGRTG